MKPRTYAILERAIEEGVTRGYRRAFKHNPNPSEEDIATHIEEAVMGAVSEYFSFSGEEYEV